MTRKRARNMIGHTTNPGRAGRAAARLRVGGKLLEGDDSDLMHMAREIALTHHKKWDGSGYPNGLAGETIPMAGRIAALADVLDALTSVRPYKQAWPIEDALAYLHDNRGKHFDPALVEVFVRELPGILAIRERFAEPA